MKRAHEFVLLIALAAASTLCAAVSAAEAKALISVAEPRVLLGGNLEGGRTLLVVEEAIPDIYPPYDARQAAPRPIYRCTVIIMSVEGKTADVVWSSLGRIEGIDARVKPFEARMFGDVLVFTYLEANDVCAQVFRSEKDGSFSHMRGGDPTLWREIAGGLVTVGAHIEGEIVDGSLCISLDERKEGKRGGPVCFRLVTRDGRDHWVPADPATTRPTSRPTSRPADPKSREQN